MPTRIRSPLVLLVAALCTVAAVGVPVHGHASHDGHDQAHVEHGHHDHDTGYAQGDERLIQRSYRIAIVVPVVSAILVDEPVESRDEPPTSDDPVGRAPPTPGSPRAPPA